MISLPNKDSASEISPARFRVSTNPVVDFLVKSVLSSRGTLALKMRSFLLRERPLNGGTVSVIVPFRNVENYLQAALESIRLQRYADLEVVLVDDGSTDRSSEIASRFTRRDERFRLISAGGIGPGAARNLGLRSVSGRYLSFVDGDDILPFGAIYRQVQALQSTDGQFCVGAFERLDGYKRWRLPWVAEQHKAYRPRVTLGEVPGITRNVFPWNKLFRRDFFEKYVGGFPEGIIYEDQVPTALAFTSATNFSVLPETVYHWRVRGSQDSITQNRSSYGHLEARVLVMHDVSKIYSEAEPIVYREWLQKSLFEDMRPFYEASCDADERYRSLLQHTCRWLWEKLTPEEQDAAPGPAAARTAAVLSGDFAALHQLNTD